MKYLDPRQNDKIAYQIYRFSFLTTPNENQLISSQINITYFWQYHIHATDLSGLQQVDILRLSSKPKKLETVIQLSQGRN